MLLIVTYNVNFSKCENIVSEECDLIRDRKVNKYIIQYKELFYKIAKIISNKDRPLKVRNYGIQKE